MYLVPLEKYEDVRDDLDGACGFRTCQFVNQTVVVSC